MPLKMRPATAPGNLSKVTPRAVTVHQHNGELIPGFGNVTARDMVVPRLKMLQGLSPEVIEDSRNNPPGELYHSTLGSPIGKQLIVVPLQIMRTIELWSPRDSNEGLLARSTDGINWDKPHTKFDVRIEGKKYTWETKGSVGESGLAEFGTSKPHNPKSAPAAALTYRLALWLLEHTELSPCLMITSRMATRPTQDLITRISTRHGGGTPFFAQRYKLISQHMIRGPNQFYVPSFRNDGNIEDKDLLATLQSTAKAMATINVRAEDERLEDDDAQAAPSRPAGNRGSQESAY